MLINFLFAAVLAGTPLLLGTVGEIICEKSGNLNLGVEGMMYMGAIVGFFVGYQSSHLLLAIICAFLAGAFGALIYAFLTVTLKADQNVTGLTLTIFGTGFANMMGDIMIANSPNNTVKLSTAFTDQLKNIDIPGLSNLPIIGKLLFSYNILVYLAMVIAIAIWFYLFHTRTGLNLRAVGENPAAADASGVSVTAVKYYNILLGGGICGIGGAYISLVVCGGVWTNNCVNGAGWIAVALVIFATWNPMKAVLGSLVFGAFSVLQFYMPKDIIHLPNALYVALPFIITSIVLVVTSMKHSNEKNQPAGCGINYFREDR